MKKTILILSAILLLSSCSKDDNTTYFQMNSIGYSLNNKTHRINKIISGNNINIIALSNEKMKDLDSFGVVISGSNNYIFSAAYIFYTNGIQKSNKPIYNFKGSLTISNGKISGELIGQGNDYIRVNNF